MTDRPATTGGGHSDASPRPAQLKPAVPVVEFAGRLTLVDKNRQSLIVLSDTARVIWEMLAAGAPAPEIAVLLAERYGITPAAARADIEMIVGRWLTEGLVGTGGNGSVTPASAPAPVRWPTRFARTYAYALCGRPLRFHFGRASLHDILHPLLAPWQCGPDGAQGAVHMFIDRESYVIATSPDDYERSSDVEDALGRAINRILDLSYPEARWLAIMHAGAVAHRGGAIVLPGASGSGKSTLTTALALSGFFYLSDDVVPLDGCTGRVMPAPFAASLKQGSWPIVVNLFPAVEQLLVHPNGDPARRHVDLSWATSQSTAAGVPVAAFVFPRFDPGAPAAIRRLDPFESLQRLLEARCWLSLDPADVSLFLGYLGDHRCFEIVYDSLSMAIEQVSRISRDEA